MDELHQKNIVIGSAISDYVFVDEKRVIVEPDESGSIQEDTDRLKRIVEDFIELIKEEDVKHELKSAFAEAGGNPLGIV